MNVLNLSDFYSYSWFSNMAYVLWNDTNTANRASMILEAAMPSLVYRNPEITKHLVTYP